MNPWSLFAVRLIRHELLHELFSSRKCKTLVHSPLLNFSVHGKVDQIASVNHLVQQHGLMNSSQV